MTTEIMIWIILLNLVLLFVLGIIFRRQISKGRLDENKFAIVACGYMSFLYITMWLPTLIIKPHFSSAIPLIPLVINLLLVWCIGYPWFRWVCRRINLRNHP